MRFTTNHDKNAWEAPAIERCGLEGLKLATVLINTIPGVPMIYTGEEVANDKKLDLFEKVDVDWNRSHEVGDIYKKLFHLRKENKALSRGEMIRLSTDKDGVVYAFARKAGSECTIVVLNFSDEIQNVIVSIPGGKLFNSRKSVRVKELFDGAEIRFPHGMKEPLTLELKPRMYKVFVARRH